MAKKKYVIERPAHVPVLDQYNASKFDRTDVVPKELKTYHALLAPMSLAVGSQNYIVCWSAIEKETEKKFLMVWECVAKMPTKAERADPQYEGKFKVQFRDGSYWFDADKVLTQLPENAIINEGVAIPSDDPEEEYKTSDDDDGSSTSSSSDDNFTEKRNGVEAREKIAKSQDKAMRAPKKTQKKEERKDYCRRKTKAMPKSSLAPEEFAKILGATGIGSEGRANMLKELENQNKHFMIADAHSLCIPVTNSMTVREVLSAIQNRAKGDLQIRKLFAPTPAFVSFKPVPLV